MISGHVKLFHAPINVKIATVSIADFTSGRTTVWKIFHVEAPSILAESIKSLGIPRIACLITNTPKNVGSGRIRALKVFTHPRPLTTRYKGTRITSDGTSMVRRSNKKILSFPLKFNFANANYIALAISGFVLSVIAQIGDLSMSIIKREFNIKDYGVIFPGHGGILDRFDSVLFTAPATFIVLQFIQLFI